MKRAVLRAAAMLALAVAPAWAAAAAPQGAMVGLCELPPGDYAGLQGGRVRAVQEILAFFGFYAAAIDGIVGRETRAGIQRYCRDPQPAAAPTPPEPRQAAGAPAPEPWPEAADISYRLGADGIEALAARNAALAALERLRADPAHEPDALAAAARQALPPATAERYLEYGANHPEPLAEADWQTVAGPAGPLPPVFLALLGGLAEAEYPERRLFAAAAQERVTTLMGIHAASIRALVAARRLVRLDDAAFAGLKNNGVPAELLALLAGVKGADYATPERLAAEVERLFDAVAARFPATADIVLAQARREHRPQAARPWQWRAAADCRCLPGRTEGTVYGFYPYWQAEAPPVVDFGVFERIGYFALGFDDRGDIAFPAQWNPASGPAIDAARRYRTRIDLVVARRDWAGWTAQSREQRAAAFDALAGNIAWLLNIELADAWSRARPYVGFGAPAPTLGDGVTLDFENYPDDPQSVELFGRLLARLGERLDGRGHFVNLMFGAEALGRGIHGYANLLRWSEQRGSAAAGRMLFLVLLREPAATAATRLRGEVEQHLAGARQRQLLRSLVPVLTPDPARRVDDSLVYLQDNFGGVGFWPLPGAAAAPEAARALKREFVPQAGPQAGAVCGLVCPNRWAFRLAFDGFLLASLGSVALYLRCCRCRATFRRRFIPILAATAIPLFALGMLLLYCDPFLEKLAAGNMPLFLLGTAVIAYVILDYRRRREIP